MPPSRHSSSSHSSSSRSSRPRSSSSSRSRSSSSSYRSHSSSSSSSTRRTSSPIATRSSYKATRSARPRINQPSGFRSSTYKSTTYYCKKHDYTYYPTDWTDESTGRVYRKGFYDEAGNRYDTLILKHNEKYENVPLHCEYCGTSIVRDLTDDTQTMSCPNCSANMIMDAILDDRDEAADYLTNGGSSYGSSYNSSYSSSRRSSGLKRLIKCFIFAVILTCIAPCSVLGFFAVSMLKNSNLTIQNISDLTQSQPVAGTQPNNGGQGNVINEDTDIFGTTIYLKAGEDGYEYTTYEDYDKVLKWSASDVSYYDGEADVYLWYNLDMDPCIWQYWYEGISSDYGDYGWMEYREGKWFVETGEGLWAELDESKYDMSKVWHFADPSDISFYGIELE
ncbi:MAG: hypothetical protein J5825_08395 [Lachnospiraceae bacterium]|nr:hypothetical protein [Lachnospiraceae bacterium]